MSLFPLILEMQQVTRVTANRMLRCGFMISVEVFLPVGLLHVEFELIEGVLHSVHVGV